MPELWLQVALLASATALPLHLCEPALGSPLCRGLATLAGSSNYCKGHAHRWSSPTHRTPDDFC